MREAVIVSACRTAIGRAVRGTLKDTRPEDLASVVMNDCVDRIGMKKELIEDVICGNAMPEFTQGMNLGRMIVLKAGFPIETSGMTVNRFCSSGLETIAIGAERIMAGWNDIVMAGGVESMSQVPMGGFNPAPHPDLTAEYPESYTPMGLTAEKVAERYEITREQQDEFAANSQAKAVKAIADGVFEEQIVPIKTRVFANGKWKEVEFKVDESPRAGTTAEGLGKLKPAFMNGGTVTAGNASTMNDGAAFVILMTKEKAKELGLTPLATFKYYVTAGVPPEVMGVGPLYAIRRLWERTGLTEKDIDLYEVNEAFASQAYYCCKELGLPDEKVNVNGGAVALGHPLGCTGAKLSVQLLYELKRRNLKRGIVSMCIGGGMGAAGLFEIEDY